MENFKQSCQNESTRNQSTTFPSKENVENSHEKQALSENSSTPEVKNGSSSLSRSSTLTKPSSNRKDGELEKAEDPTTVTVPLALLTKLFESVEEIKSELKCLAKIPNIEQEIREIKEFNKKMSQPEEIRKNDNQSTGFDKNGELRELLQESFNNVKPCDIDHFLEKGDFYRILEKKNEVSSGRIQKQSSDLNNVLSSQKRLESVSIEILECNKAELEKLDIFQTLITEKILKEQEDLQKLIVKNHEMYLVDMEKFKKLQKDTKTIYMELRNYLQRKEKSLVEEYRGDKVVNAVKDVMNNGILAMESAVTNNSITDKSTDATTTSNYPYPISFWTGQQTEMEQNPNIVREDQVLPQITSAATNNIVADRSTVATTTSNYPYSTSFWTGQQAEMQHNPNLDSLNYFSQPQHWQHQDQPVQKRKQKPGAQQRKRRRLQEEQRLSASASSSRVKIE